MRKHHEFGPSKFPVWWEAGGNCIHFTGDESRDDDEDTTTGTLAHKLLSDFIRDSGDEALMLKLYEDADLDVEIKDGVIWAYGEVMQIADKNGSTKGDIRTEVKLNFRKDFYGYADVVMAAGRIDVTTIDDREKKKIVNPAVIIDFKTFGWLEKDHFAQLCGYVLALCDEEKIDEVQCFLLSGAVRRIETQIITREKAEEVVLRIIGRRRLILKEPKRFPYNPNDWCGFCALKFTCSAYLSTALVVVEGEVPETKLAAWTEMTFGALQSFSYDPARTSTAPQLSRLYIVAYYMERWAADAKAYVEKKILDEGVEVPFVKVSPGRKLKKITDPRKAWLRVSDLVSAEYFAACCKISLPKLKSALHVSLQFRDGGKGKVTKVRAAEMVEELLAGLIEEEQLSPILSLKKSEPLGEGEKNETLPRAPLE